MNYEKKYKEAVELMKDCVPDENGLVHVRPCDIFPELKESEDEKTIKEIKQFIRSRGMSLAQSKVDSWIAWLEKRGEQKPVISYDALREGIGHFGITQYQIDNWLKKYVDVEKQGEQKSVDKVEPKFKVGDWIVIDGEVLHIKEITEDGYLTDKGWFIPFRCEKEARIWTIKDAKAGDVLVNDFHLIFILKEIKNNTFFSHCSVIERGNDVITNSITEREVGDSELVKVYPATQEQRSKLFSKMAEEGYEWDAENLKLKKIEKMPAEWSEEDETGLTNTIIMLKEGASLHFNKNDITKAVDWFKSLKERYAFKPSKEQMEALWNVYRGGKEQAELATLYNDLKKLREE